MYCYHCGKELDDDAKFCTHCGTKVIQEDNEDQPDTGLRASSGSSKDEEVTETEKSTSSESNAKEEKNEQSLQTSDKESTLKAAVASNRKRSRRRMPLILLVALVLALTASIAFAAYYVYTQYFAAQPEETEVQPQQPQTEESEEQPQQQPQVETDHQENWDDALDTYQQVLDDYIAAADEFNSSGTIEYNSETDSYEHPYANAMGILDYGAADAAYALDDLNNDGSPELLVSHAEQGNTPGILLGVYTIVDGQPKIVTTESWTRNSLVYLGNNQFSYAGSGGFDSAVFALMTWNGDYLKSIEDYKETLTTIASLSYTWINDDDRGKDSSLYEVTITTSDGTTDETIPYSELQSTIEEFKEQHMPDSSSDSTLQWSSLTNQRKNDVLRLFSA